MKKEVSPPPSPRLRRASKIISYLPQIMALLFIAAFAVYAWTEPSQSPPSGNVASPINVGTEPQAKAGRFTATEFYDYNDPNYYLNPSGDSKINSMTIVGGPSFPSCDSSYRGKMFLLQSGSGTEDGLYVCKKKADGTYTWIALASPYVSGQYYGYCVPKCQQFDCGDECGADFCYSSAVSVFPATYSCTSGACSVCGNWGCQGATTAPSCSCSCEAGFDLVYVGNLGYGAAGPGCNEKVYVCRKQ